VGDYSPTIKELRRFIMGGTVGGDVKTLTAFHPQTVSGEVVMYGPAIDRKGYNSAVFTLMTGYTGGTATNIDIPAHVMECATADGTYADVVDPTDSTNTTFGVGRFSGEVAGLIRSVDEIDLDLRSLKQYLMLKITPDFVGAGCVIDFAASVTLGEPSVKPAV
jgi:hypothetical protein